MVFVFRVIYKITKILFYRFPDYGKATDAAEQIFAILNRKPMINNESEDGHVIVSEYYYKCLKYVYFIIIGFFDSLISQEN